MNSRSLLVFALITLPFGAALAQDAAEVGTPAAPVKDKQSVTFDEVESGIFLGARAGFSYLVNAPFKGPSSPGESAAIEIGTDLGERFSIALGVSFSANRTNGTYTGKAGTGAASGDFSMLVPNASLKANLIGFSDGQDVKRTYFYVRGGAGYVFFSPRALLPQSDILVFAGPGVEYYTRLRHFSVGLEVTASYLLTSASFGFAVTPSLRYAF